MSLVYRPEIDGLRTVAVVPVILFHAGAGLFSGGYVGVDVFFVISGFLITSIIAQDLQAGRFSILDFYERRARRILPALFAMVATSIVLAALFMTPRLYEKFMESVVSTVFFFSNIYYWKTLDYFAVDAEMTPLLHTWSLAVEEQYYIFFPIFMMLAWKFGRSLTFWLLVLVSVVSLALSEWGSIHYSWAAFYLLPTRAWELLAGSLAALWLMGRVRQDNQILALAGLVMICVPIVLYDETVRFPSVYAIPPVLGAVLIILFGGPGTWVGRVLSTRMMVGIGLISYSLYLWHQPLLAFGRITIGEELGLFWASALVALTFAMATLSLFSIERPFRKRGHGVLPRQGHVFAASLGGMALLVLCAVHQIWDLGRDRLAFQQIAYSDTLIRWETVTDAYQAYEQKERGLPFPEPKGQGRNVLFVGDSHARDLYNALSLNPDIYGHLTYRRVALDWKCIRELSSYGGAQTAQECVDVFVGKRENVLEGTDIALLSIRWTARGAPELYLEEHIKALRGFGIEPVILSGTPEYRPDGPVMLRRLHEQDRLTRDVWEHTFHEHLNPHIRPMNDRVKAIAERLNVPYVEKWDYMCDLPNERCKATDEEGVALFYDYGHTTLDGAIYVGREIDRLGLFEGILPSANDP